MEHASCDLVIKHEGLLGMIAADISHIKKKVDNGLSEDLAKVSQDLITVERTLAEFVSSVVARNVKMDSDNTLRETKVDAANWFNRILSNSVSKIVGYATIFIIANSLVNNGLVIFLEDKYSKEPPGQQQTILKQQASLQSVIGTSYHSHVFPDGKVLLHSGSEMEPAWLLDGKTNVWEKAPTMRTDQGIK